MPTPSGARPTRSKKRLRLKPADSFDLIRLLARSQHDPRKAVCELIQNSLDATARRIDVTWFRDRGVRALRIRDDGVGVFPDLPRPDALKKIATTIGHSHKRDLTPAERRELLALGKYGIGLLGFWSVGEQMRIRSRVGGGETWVLELLEDSPNAKLDRARARRLDEEATFTEVTIRGIHEAVVRQLRPGRLQSYLAGELRGQLLGRDVDLLIHDRIARGRAVKEFRVVAQRYRGAHIADLDRLTVAGHESARVEIYLIASQDDRVGRVALACGGTTVLDDLADLDGTDEPRAPWCSGRLEGVVDFPDLEVAPGTRRGFVRNEAAAAFAGALLELESRLAEVLAEDERRQEEEKDKTLARRLQRVFRRITKLLPEYDLFDVGRDQGSPTSASSTGEAVAEPAAEGAAAEGDPDASDDEAGFLFEPGPLAAVRISPQKSRMPPETARTLRARAVDDDGRPARGEIEFDWSVDGAGTIAGSGARAVFEAPPHEASVTVTVRARQGRASAEAAASIEIADDLGRAGAGIPDPLPVHAGAEPWRSRMRDGVWEYNTGHRDYAAAATSEARRLRYLVHLFAKEVVFRNFGGPGDGDILERMVQVLTYLDDTRKERES